MMKKYFRSSANAILATIAVVRAVQGPAFLSSKWTRRCFTALALAGLTFLITGGAHSITAPAAGGLFYDAYDIVINSMLKGAVGFVAAILIFAMSIGLFLMQKVVPGIVGIVCAAILIKADTIVSSLGAIF
jgi:hypothetical protein